MDSRAFLNTLISECNKDLDDAVKDARIQFGKWEREYLRETFNKAITDFYNDYSPKKYHRLGDTNSETGGLYDLFELSGLDSEGAIMDFPDQNEYSELYDPSRMHEGRKGYNGLYQLVFVEGWHGGSKSISSEKEEHWGVHPEPGTPHYRKRGYSKLYRRRYKYAKWGSRAERSNPPPKELVKQYMSSDFPVITTEWKRTKKEYEDKKFDEFVSGKAQKLINDFFEPYLERLQKAVM